MPSCLTGCACLGMAGNARNSRLNWKNPTDFKTNSTKVRQQSIVRGRDSFLATSEILPTTTSCWLSRFPAECSSGIMAITRWSREFTREVRCNLMLKCALDARASYFYFFIECPFSSTMKKKWKKMLPREWAREVRCNLTLKCALDACFRFFSLRSISKLNAPLGSRIKIIGGRSNSMQLRREKNSKIVVEDTFYPIRLWRNEQAEQM